jgi:hypothetical protein
MIRNVAKLVLLPAVLAVVPAAGATKQIRNQASTRVVVVYWDTKNQMQSVAVEKGSTAALPVKSADDIPFGIYVIFDKPDKDRTPMTALWFDQWNTRELQLPVYRVDDKSLSPMVP